MTKELHQLLKENEQFKRRLDLLEARNQIRNAIPTYSFSKISFSELKNIVEIKPKLNYDKFNHWFNDENIILNEKDILFLKNLIDKNIFFMENYKEEDLKVKFITPILNRIDFINIDKEIRDFYDENLFYQTEQFILNGETDFVVAKGYFYSEKPYFFYTRV
jgi:hypothetical protein